MIEGIAISRGMLPFPAGMTGADEDGRHARRGNACVAAIPYRVGLVASPRADWRSGCRAGRWQPALLIRAHVFQMGSKPALLLRVIRLRQERLRSTTQSVCGNRCSEVCLPD